MQYCQGCNCKNCLNTVSHEDERQHAVMQMIKRDPKAFGSSRYADDSTLHFGGSKLSKKEDDEMDASEHVDEISSISLLREKRSMVAYTDMTTKLPRNNTDQDVGLSRSLLNQQLVLQSQMNQRKIDMRDKQPTRSSSRNVFGVPRHYIPLPIPFAKFNNTRSFLQGMITDHQIRDFCRKLLRLVRKEEYRGTSSKCWWLNIVIFFSNLIFHQQTLKQKDPTPNPD